MTTPRHSVGQARYLAQAACRPHPTSWWFSEDAESVEAYLICASCPVQAQCLAFALDHSDLVGIWGATTTAERSKLRRSHRHPSFGAHADDTRESCAARSHGGHHGFIVSLHCRALTATCDWHDEHSGMNTRRTEAWDTSWPPDCSPEPVGRPHPTRDYAQQKGASWPSMTNS